MRTHILEKWILLAFGLVFFTVVAYGNIPFGCFSTSFLDTIDVTNLNRQFLFRSKDVGQSKAVVAAKFINERCPWMNVVPYHGKIQDKDATFYRQFKVVISGLDNVEARR